MELEDFSLVSEKMFCLHLQKNMFTHEQRRTAAHVLLIICKKHSRFCLVQSILCTKHPKLDVTENIFFTQFWHSVAVKLTSVSGSATTSSGSIPASSGSASSSFALFSFFFFFFSLFASSADGVLGVVVASPSLSAASLFLCRTHRWQICYYQLGR